MLPKSERTHVITDNTSSEIPPQVAAFVRAGFFNETTTNQKVYIIYKVQVKKSEVDILGEWICRVDYIFESSVNGITVNEAFGYYKDAFNLSQHYANAFLQHKYPSAPLLPVPSDQEMLDGLGKILLIQN